MASEQGDFAPSDLEILEESGTARFPREGPCQQLPDLCGDSGSIQGGALSHACRAGNSVPSRETRGREASGGNAMCAWLPSSEPAILMAEVPPPNTSDDPNEARRGMAPKPRDMLPVACMRLGAEPSGATRSGG